jgi:hypothetical protein
MNRISKLREDYEYSYDNLNTKLGDVRKDYLDLLRMVESLSDHLGLKLTYVPRKEGHYEFTSKLPQQEPQEPQK